MTTIITDTERRERDRADRAGMIVGQNMPFFSFLMNIQMRSKDGIGLLLGK
jgi:hypothetical protein